MARPTSDLRKKKKNNERGVALVIALFALLILSAIATGMMFMADTETAVNMNYRDAQQAYFGSMAGLEEAHERLRPNSANLVTAPTGMPSDRICPLRGEIGIGGCTPPNSALHTPEARMIDEASIAVCAK